MMTSQEIIEQIRKEIPAFQCRPGCSDCCGPVVWSKWEWENTPIKKKATGIDCPYICEAGCEIYEDRPILCRLFGVVHALQCPHVVPSIVMSELQSKDIMDRYLSCF